MLAWRFSCWRGVLDVGVAPEIEKPVFRNTFVLKFELVYLPEMSVDMT